MALNLGPGEYHLTVAAHTFDVHIHDSFDWIERALVLKILPPLAGKCIGVAFLQPTVTYQQTTNQREPERWEQTLALLFDQHFPRELQVAETRKPWLFAGWHALEGAGDTAFCWTQESFSFLLDLRGSKLCLEMGTDRPDTGNEPVTVSAWIFDQPLEPLVMGGTERWAVYSFPIPQAYQVAHGLVRMHVKGWCPAESGMGEDRRILGLRIRRIWVAEKYQDS